MQSVVNTTLQRPLPNIHGDYFMHALDSCGVPAGFVNDVKISPFFFEPGLRICLDNSATVITPEIFRLHHCPKICQSNNR